MSTLPALPVLVIGAGRGIGAAIVRELRYRGVTVIEGHRQVPVLDKGDDRRESVVEVDIADPLSVQRAADWVGARFPRLGGVIISAGVTYDASTEPAASKGPLDLIKAEAVQHVFRVNTIGPLLTVQAFAPLVGSGTFMMLTSHRGSLALTDSGSSIAYAISKAALNMVVRKLGYLVDDATVFGVHPGWVATDLGGAEAPITPAQAADDLVRLFAGATKDVHGLFVDSAGQQLPW